MSNYQFLPSPTFGLGEHTFATWENGFSLEEIQKIIKYGDQLCLNQASVGGSNGGVVDAEIRRSKTAWISCNNETQWLYDKLAFIARQLNGQFFNFDLYGFSEDFQYTVYESNDQGFYDWHLDRGNQGGSPPRKFSMVLQLSDPYEYEGGNLEIMGGRNVSTVLKQRGLVAAFPSFMLHRVTPVTAGIRKTLVVWITGPAFR